MADETKVELVRNSVETKMRMIKTLVLEGENEEVNKVEKKLIGDIKNLIKKRAMEQARDGTIFASCS